MSFGEDLNPAWRGFEPGGRVAGALRVPSSKSLAQRALLAAALASGRTRIAHLPNGEDVHALRAALASLGVETTSSGPASCTIVGRPPGLQGGLGARASRCSGATHAEAQAQLSVAVGESGTAARFLTTALALCAAPGTRFRVEGRGSLSRRGSRALFDALRDAGVEIALSGEGGWPLELRAIGPPSTLRLRQPNSSQELSALLIAAAAYPDTIAVLVLGAIPSRPYVDLTLDVLRRFGVDCVEQPVASVEREDLEGCAYEVRGSLRAPRDPLAIEPDASAAGVGLVAACLTGGEAWVPGLASESAQGDVRVVEHLRAFGSRAGSDSRGLWAAGFPTRAAVVDCSSCPDLAPPLCALAAAVAGRAGQQSEIRGLVTLPGKESSRIEVLALGLRRLGLRASAHDDRILIGPGEFAPASAPPGGARLEVLDPAGDHRMAFTFALLGLLRPGVRVATPDCVAKSWPSFWDDLSRAGARAASLGTGSANE